MIKIENCETFNFEGALRGMRNPLDSWSKSDSYKDKNNNFIIGQKDMQLAQRLIKSGSEHAKFLRQIFVTMDITAPLYWWKEMDQYKIGTTTNSCSTMHKITSYPITPNLFSFDDELNELQVFDTIEAFTIKDNIDFICATCEKLRQKYLETKDKRYWRALIQILPESWNQKRTWTGNYQILGNIYKQRDKHKLSEWNEFLNFLEKLPYFKELILCSEEENGK